MKFMNVAYLPAQVKAVVTFPNLREGVLSVNSQIVSLETFLSKRSFGNNSFVKVK